MKQKTNYTHFVTITYQSNHKRHNRINTILGGFNSIEQAYAELHSIAMSVSDDHVYDDGSSQIYEANKLTRQIDQILEMPLLDESIIDSLRQLRQCDIDLYAEYTDGDLSFEYDSEIWTIYTADELLAKIAKKDFEQWDNLAYFLKWR